MLFRLMLLAFCHNPPILFSLVINRFIYIIIGTTHSEYRCGGSKCFNKSVNLLFKFVINAAS